MSISVPSSACMGHFKVPMPSTGKPEPMPFIFKLVTGCRLTKLPFLVERHAEAPVSIQIRSVSVPNEKVRSNAGVVRLYNRACNLAFPSTVLVSCDFLHVWKWACQILWLKGSSLMTEGLGLDGNCDVVCKGLGCRRLFGGGYSPLFQSEINQCWNCTCFRLGGGLSGPEAYVVMGKKGCNYG